MDDYRKKGSELRQKIFVEPVGCHIRPAIVEFIKLLVARAGRLSNEELLRGEGVDISSAICGALAWQGARGVEGNDWITAEDEPELYELLRIAGTLDVDNEQLGQWMQLFKVAGKL